jgi:hypothetical protein
VTDVPCTVLFCKKWRQWLHEQSRIHEQARDFSVFKAKCGNEEDRPVVQRSIATFMKGIGLVPKDAPDDAALKAFDMKVHQEVPRALEVSLGRVGIPYGYACVIFLPTALNGMESIGLVLGQDHQSVWPSAASPARLVCLAILGYAIKYLAVYPAILALFSLVMRASLRLHKRAPIWATCVLTAMVGVALDKGWDLLHYVYLLLWANESDVGLAVFLATHAAMFGVVTFLYRPLLSESRGDRQLIVTSHRKVMIDPAVT